MIFSWLRCTNWATLWVWSTPTTPQPSWLPSTSGWTPRTLNFPTTIAEEYSSFMVNHWHSKPLSNKRSMWYRTPPEHLELKLYLLMCHVKVRSLKILVISPCLRRVRIRPPSPSCYAPYTQPRSPAHIFAGQASLWPQHLRWPLWHHCHPQRRNVCVQGKHL